MTDRWLTRWRSRRTAYERRAKITGEGFEADMKRAWALSFQWHWVLMDEVFFSDDFLDNPVRVRLFA